MLKEVNVLNGELIATRHNAKAIGEKVEQEVGETDFESVRESRGFFLLKNISDSVLSTADTCVANTPLAVNDRIFIRTNDGTVHDSKVTAVTKGDNPLIPITKNGFIYDFEDFVYADYMIVNASYSNGGGRAPTFNAEASVDGVNWTTLYTGVVEFSSYSQKDVMLNFYSPGKFRYYKFYMSGDTYSMGTNSMNIYDSEGEQNTVDTSPFTQGEIPTHVFKFEDTIKINGVTAIEKDVYYNYGANGEYLKVIPLYNDILISGRELQTEINFSATGNKLTEFSGQIFKLEQE